MTIKRAIPRVAVASLTLGGGAGAAVVGCGGGGSEARAIENFCQHMADCYGYGSAYVNECRDEIETYLSYYSSSCRRAARRVLECLTATSCSEFYYDFGYSSCYDEWQALYRSCDFDYYDY